MAQLTLKIPIKERDALFRLAERERRDPRDQAALIIRSALEQCGLLSADSKADSLQKHTPSQKEHVLA